jgi:hypothetical protein
MHHAVQWLCQSLDMLAETPTPVPLEIVFHELIQLSGCDFHRRLILRQLVSASRPYQPLMHGEHRMVPLICIR